MAFWRRLAWALLATRCRASSEEREICTDDCNFYLAGVLPVVGDGECDDGSPAAQWAICPCGSDCTDCGPQTCFCPELELVEEHECPTAFNYPPCSTFGLEHDDLCEGDGECGTSQLADNCVSGNGFYDIYRVIGTPGDGAASKKKTTKRLPPWILVVISILCVLVVGALVAALYFCLRAKKIQDQNSFQMVAVGAPSTLPTAKAEEVKDNEVLVGTVVEHRPAQPSQEEDAL